jgi:tRNA (cmo5U34)-methyltransferase
MKENNKQRDEVFRKKLDKINDFVFDESVASVFDDMVSRSVPFYDEIHRIILDISKKVIQSGDTICDLGCSTGTTIGLIENMLRKRQVEVKFLGVDNSRAMIERCDKKLRGLYVRDYELKQADLTGIKLKPAKMFIMNYTLQFLPMEKRLDLLQQIYQNLRPGGVFIMAEKILGSDEDLNHLFVELYYDFKRRNGYSELEISQKREALENVLVPLSPQQQLENLSKAGFQKTDIVFRWYNFATFVGVKS